MALPYGGAICFSTLRGSKGGEKMNPSLVVKGRVKTLVVAVVMVAFGAAILGLAKELVGRECSPGRNELICDLMAQLPPWAQLSIMVFFGALCVYVGLRMLWLVIRGVALLSFDENGITFDATGPVFVPWGHVTSLSVSRRAVTIRSHTPQRVRHIFGWTRETDKFVVPLFAGRAYVDGKIRWWSAANSVRKWIRERSGHGAQRREPGAAARA